jgi:hypothetical protein
MNAEEVPIIPLVLGALGVMYFGYEIERQRHKLRQIFGTFDRDESRIAEALEILVKTGQITAYVPGELPVT